MKPLPEHTLRALRKISLAHDSKDRIRAALSSYAQMHAVRAVSPAAPSLFFSYLPGRSLYAGALMALVFVGGGAQIAHMAEGAVPGDALYSIKVTVNEPLALLIATPEGKAELSARYATRRIDEATELSARGTLTDETADVLAERFSTHVDTLAKDTQVLEAKGDGAVSLAVRADLEADVTARIPASVSANTATMMMAKSDMRLEHEEVREDRNDPQARFSQRVIEKSRELASAGPTLDTSVDERAAVAADVSTAATMSVAAEAPTELFSARLTPEETIATLSGTTTPTSTIPVLNVLPREQ